jgi:hypothetical protein
VDRPKALACASWIGRPEGFDVPPERHDAAGVVVRSGIKLVGGGHDGRTGMRRVRRHGKLACDVVRIRPFRKRPAGGHARDDLQRLEVHEDVPCVPQHEGLVATQPVCARNRNCDPYSAVRDAF